MTIEQNKLTEAFLTSAILTRRELLESGLSRRQIDAYLESGAIERVAKNLYARQESTIHAHFDFMLANRMTDGLIWSHSAGSFHGLTDDTPRTIWVLTPTHAQAAAGGLDLTVQHTRNEKLLTVGIDRISDSGFSFPITNKARTVVDLYRLGEVRQHAIEAIRTYLAENNSTQELQAMAAEFGVEREFDDMISMTLCAFERTPTR
jgi:predicted transcriptional regulator of viral defense system